MCKIFKFFLSILFAFVITPHTQASPLFIDLYTPHKTTSHDLYNVTTDEIIKNYTINMNAEPFFEMTKEFFQYDQNHEENLIATPFSPDAEECLRQILMQNMQTELFSIQSILKEFVQENIHIEIKQNINPYEENEILKLMREDIVEKAVGRICTAMTPDFFNEQDLSSNATITFPHLVCTVRTCEYFNIYWMKLCAALGQPNTPDDIL